MASWDLISLLSLICLFFSPLGSDIPDPNPPSRSVQRCRCRVNYKEMMLSSTDSDWSTSSQLPEPDHNLPWNTVVTTTSTTDSYSPLSDEEDKWVYNGGLLTYPTFSTTPLSDVPDFDDDIFLHLSTRNYLSCQQSDWTDVDMLLYQYGDSRTLWSEAQHSWSKHSHPTPLSKILAGSAKTILLHSSSKMV